MGMWFQVQEELIEHPKTTKLRKELGCSQLEAAGIVLAVFSRGVRQATKEGNFISDDKDDIARYLAYVNAGTELGGDQMVEALISAGWLDELDGLLRIHDWAIWQAALYSAIEKREKDADRKRRARQGSQRPPVPEPEDVPSAEIPQDSPPDNPQTVPEKSDDPPEPLKPEKKFSKYGPEFEEFWKAYPRSEGKGEAFKKYQARRKDGWSAEELLMAAQNYAIRCRKLRTEKQYIKHPKTFLSDSTPFVDYIPKKQEQPAPTEQGGVPFAECNMEGT